MTDEKLEAGVAEDNEDWRARALLAEEKLAAREYEDALMRGLSDVQFSSEAARRDVVARIGEAGLTVEGGELSGLSAFLDAIRAEDPGAFACGASVRFTDSIGGGDAAMTRERIMAIRDRGERRAAIARNMALFER